MMKANELRIGNLVGLNNSEWNEFNQFFDLMDNSDVKMFLEDKNKHAMVTSIANEIELMAYGVDLDYYALSEILPIPLTEEWLIKFGFDRVGDWAGIDFNPRMGIRFYDGNSGECDITQDDKFIAFKQGHIKYVHQLQNLYFALTGEELEIKL